MASLYLGKIGDKENVFEIHALTKDLPFREFKTHQISDTTLFHELQKSRYKLLETGKPIFCTAINPDFEKKIESNPHDEREGTIHLVALNKKGSISCAVSVAIDIGAKDKGELIGVPLENRWRRNNYPEGKNLDEFRVKYLDRNYGNNRAFQPWEMAEFYRHFKSADEKSNISCRLGLYTGCYHLFMREAQKKGIRQTLFWVFDAIPAYFELYKFAGAAVLRDFTIKETMRYISPGKRDIEKKEFDGVPHLLYGNEVISRNIKVPIFIPENGQLTFEYQEIPFLDGLVDIWRIDQMAKQFPIFLNLKGIEGLNFMDKIKIRSGLAIIGKRGWEEDGPTNFAIRSLNNFILKNTQSNIWSFNEIGKIKGKFK